MRILDLKILFLSIVAGAALVSLSAVAMDNVKDEQVTKQKTATEFSTDHLTPLQKK